MRNLKTAIRMNLRRFAELFTVPCIAFLLLIAGCKPDDPEPWPAPETDYTKGIFIINEGGFTAGNASVSWKHPDTAAVRHDVFNLVNGEALGDVLNSASTDGKSLFLVVNNSQKVEVVDINDFKSLGTITGATMPRYFLQIGINFGLLSDWGSNEVKVVNLVTYSTDTTLATGQGPEELTMCNGFAYVANSGGFGIDSTITCINISSHGIHKQEIIHPGPYSLVADVNDNLWILCQGDYKLFADTSDDVGGALVKYDPATETVVKKYLFPNQEHPNKMAIDHTGENIYYLNKGAVWKFSISGNALPSTPFIQKSFYGIDIDKTNGKIYCADAGDFSSAGAIEVYDAGGVLIETIEAGVAPNGVVFPW